MIHKDSNPFQGLRFDQYFVHRDPSCPVDYEQEYWDTIVDPDGVVRVCAEERERKINDLKEELAFINARPPGRFLDVGCGSGHVLSGVDPHWERHGVEVSRYAAEQAREWGGIIHHGTLEDVAFPDNHFDVVLSYHVLEHVEAPVPLVREMRRVLKDDGVMIIGVPNFDSGCARRFGEAYRMLDDPSHITLFSEDSLRRLLRDQGMVVERVDFPYFDTPHFTQENLMRLFDTGRVSPPFYGNLMTMYARKMTRDEARQTLSHLAASLTAVMGSLD